MPDHTDKGHTIRAHFEVRGPDGKLVREMDLQKHGESDREFIERMEGVFAALLVTSGLRPDLGSVLDVDKNGRKIR